MSQRLSPKRGPHGPQVLTTTDRRRALDPARAVAARALDRARGARAARSRAPHRLHDRAQAAADHDGEGAGGARRVAAQPRVQAARQRGSRPAPAGERPARQGVPGIRVAARDARARGQAGVARRAERDPAVAEAARGEAVMNQLVALLRAPLADSLAHALLQFAWQGAAIAALLAVLLHLARHRSPNLRYALCCGALVLMALAPLVTLLAADPPQLR